MKPEPKSPYAITKLNGEYYCALYRESFGLPTVCSRFFNVFGERQDTASPYAAAVPIFVSRVLNNEPIRIYGDGTQTRDFIYVKDVVNALIFLMQKAEGVFNIGYGKAIEINSLAKFVNESLQSKLEIVHVPERPGEIRHSCASVEKLSRLNFQAEYSVEDGLQKTIQWYCASREYQRSASEPHHTI